MSILHVWTAVLMCLDLLGFIHMGLGWLLLPSLCAIVLSAGRQVLWMILAVIMGILAAYGLSFLFGSTSSPGVFAHLVSMKGRS